MKKVIIVGGGTAAWICAYRLMQTENVKQITVINSGEIPIIGTGEGATGALSDLILKGDDQEFLRKTNSTKKLGIRFENWLGKGKHFDKPVDGWYYNRNHDKHIMRKIINADADLSDYSVNAFLMKHESNNFESVKRYTYHFDGKQVGQYFKEKCLASEKVKNIIDTITDIVDIDGSITKLVGKNGIYTADFYIDSTGFARLFNKKFKHDFEDYSEYLDIDSAVPFLLEQRDQSYTVSRALDNGWMWEVPKTNNLGCGYNFSSKHCTYEQALDEVQSYLGYKVKPIKHIKYQSGCFPISAKNNYAYIGLSASFIEPLEATALHTTIYNADSLVDYFDNKITLQQYNDLCYEMISDFRDYIILHYRKSPRKDTQFWIDQHNKPIPKKLQKQIEIFENGSLECLYKHTHIYFMFTIGLPYNLFGKAVDYENWDIHIPTLKTIERLKLEYS